MVLPSLTICLIMQETPASSHRALTDHSATSRQSTAPHSRIPLIAARSRMPPITRVCLTLHPPCRILVLLLHRTSVVFACRTMHLRPMLQWYLCLLQSLSLHRTPQVCQNCRRNSIRQTTIATIIIPLHHCTPALQLRRRTRHRRLPLFT